MELLEKQKKFMCSYGYSTCNLMKKLTLMTETLEACQENKGLIIKFTGGNNADIERANEAVSRIIQHVLNHYDASRGPVEPYVKALAKTILQDNVSKKESLFSEFVSDDKEQSQNVVVDMLSNRIREPEEFTIDVLNRTSHNSGIKQLNEIILSYIPDFLDLGRQLISHEICKDHVFNQGFKRQCKKYRESYSTEIFISDITKIYTENNDMLTWFNELTCSVNKWCPADFKILKSSRRITVNDKGYKGTIKKNEFIVRVDYSDAIKVLYDKYNESVTNEVKCYLGDSYVCRTLAGDYTCTVNPNIESAFAIQHQEVLTNVFQTVYKGMKVLDFDASSVWGIVNKADLSDIEIDVYGIKLLFKIEYLMEVSG